MSVSNLQLPVRLLALVALLSFGSAAYAGGPDTDGDGIPDSSDNCILVFNPLQQDTDTDGFGNFCDGDFNNDGIVNLFDLGLMRQAFFSILPNPPYDPDIDMNSDGSINFVDLQLLKTSFFQPPGPSANQAPTDIQLDNNSVDENQPAGTAVGTLTTTDINLFDTHTYTLTFGGGDTDNAQFAIVGDQLETAAVLNYEAADNCLTSATTCSIRVQTDDGNGGIYQESLIININDVNEAPVITSDGGGATASVNAAEDQTAVTTVTATDADLPPQTLTFSITGGADAALFSIGGASGVLTFSSAPDFENPLDAGGNNVYDVQVTVTDNGAPNLTDIQDIAVTVTDANDAPVITSDGGGATASVNAAENQTAATTVTATDADVPAQILTFSITGGADQALFSIGGASGVLTFNAAPDFENPTDAGGNNVYDVQVTVTDNGAPNLSDVQDIAITVTDVNDAPVITSDGGGATASVNAAEDQTAVTTVTATDADLPPQTLTFSITGGADAALFSIGGASGVLTFSSAPDFENPLDAGGNNVYDVQVTVTDNGAPNLSDIQDIAVTVTDANDAPVITSDGGGATASVNAAENQTAATTVTATDADVPAQILTFSITGGADQALFSIGGASGVLTFNAAPDFENPTDAGGNGVYDVQVTVTDNGAPNLSDVQDIAITVTDVNDAPVITSDGGGATASVNAAEDQTAVTTVTATDADLPPQTLTFSITGGADAALFSIGGASGVLTFSSAPDFENPLDAGGNNVYDVQVTVTDNGAPNLSDVQDIAVTVTDANDAPVITSDGGGATASVNAAENQTAATTVTATDADVPAQTLTFSITGGADQALFSIGGASGVLTFNAAPDFENPTDAGGNGVYDVQVTVTDNGAPNLSDVQDIAITVTDVNDAPVITSDGGGATSSVNAAENQTTVTTVTASDTDIPAQTLTFSITGGADQALFSIGGASGVLTFNAAPDFENPTDAGGNGVYDVQVTVTDNGAPNLSDVQDIAVTVTDVNEAPVITSNGGGATASVNAAENQTAVTTVTATDADVPAQTLTFSITGGADQALFSIGGASGVLTFNAAPDFENPTDAGGNGVYDVQVTVTDNGAPNLTDVQDIAVTVTDVDPENVAPVITSDGGGATAALNAAENQTAVTTVTAADADLPAQILTFSITGGADQALFSIGAASGVLTFNAAPDFENPTDAGGNNVYDVQVTVTDNGAPNLSDIQDIAVTVTDVNEAPSITTPATPSVAENTTAVIDINSTDPEGDVEGAGLTYSLTGGADQSLFNLNVNTGQLDFAAAPDFENPGDANADNVYLVQVTVTDSGGMTDVQDLAVTVTDVDDNMPPIALDDPYSGAIGNTLFELVAAPGPTPFPPTVQVVGNILDNDSDPDTGDTLSTTAETVPTFMGGSATIDANGRFVYSPAAGFPGSGVFGDSFTYEVCDDAAVPLCDNGTVTIDGSNIVWYVDDLSPNNPGTGTADDPFRDLSSAAGPSLAGETIFVFSGTQTTGITLKNNQPLIGEGVPLVINTITLVGTGTRPVISTAGTAITLGTSNTIRGIDIIGSNTGITGTGFGTLTADTMAINTTGGAALDLTTGAGSVNFDSVSSSGSAIVGINLSDVSGMFSLGGGTISGSTNDAFNVGNSTATIDYDGTISAGSALAVDIQLQSANSVSFGGPINSVSGEGINLANNTGGTITFSGGMSLSTAGNVGINATGGGTLNICGDSNCSAPGGTASTNTIDNGAAVALLVSSVAIGSEGLTFRSISSDGGGSTGITLNATGTAGGLTVTGDGTTTQGGNDTGGIIQNKTDGVRLTDTQGITLQNMTIGDTAASSADGPDATNNIALDGIVATGVTNLSLQSVTIARTGKHGINAVSVSGAPSLTNLTIDDSLFFNAGDDQEEHGLNLDELRGDNFVRDSLFDAFNETGIEVINTSGTVDLTVSNTTFQDNKLTVGNAGEEAILLEAQGSATIVALVTNGSTFDDIARQAIQAVPIGSTSNIQLTVESSMFLEDNAGDATIIMNPDGSGSGNITVRNNMFTDDTLGAFAVLAKNDSSGTLDATIQGNTTTNMQLLNINHDDIGGSGAANGTTRALIGGTGMGQGNTANVNSNNIAIDIIATEVGPVGTNPDLSLTIQNNTSTQPDGNFSFVPGLRIEGGNNARVVANMTGNAFQGDPTFSGGSGIEYRELDSSVLGLQGFAGGTAAAAGAFIDSNNPASAAASFVTSANGIGGGTATLPTATTQPSP